MAVSVAVLVAVAVLLLEAANTKSGVLGELTVAVMAALEAVAQLVALAIFTESIKVSSVEVEQVASVVAFERKNPKVMMWGSQELRTTPEVLLFRPGFPSDHADVQGFSSFSKQFARRCWVASKAITSRLR